MRTVRIDPFRNDDLVYRFASRRGPAGREVVGFDTMRRMLDGADAKDRATVVISGSDPLEHDDFPRLVDECRGRGFRHFRLVTDGFGLAHDAVVRFLRESGVHEILAVLPSADPDAYAGAMRTRTRYAACIAGIEKAARAGIETHVVVPLTRWSADSLDATLAWMKQIPLSGGLVEYPDISRVPAEAHPLLLRYDEAARVVSRIFGDNRRNRRTSGFGERWLIPACAADGALDDYGDLFNQRNRHYRVRESNRLVRVAACGSCDLAPACLGVEAAYVDVFGTEGLRPIPLEEANAWYTKPINRLEEIPFKRVSPYEPGKENHGTLGLLRINGHCNMGCSFCFVDLSQPDVPENDLTAEIDELAARGVTDLVISGGEPTLHPGLPALIAYAKTKSFASIELQSNGVRLASREFAQAMADSGLDIACISLHSHKPEESDRITKRPKAFGRTVQAIHNLRDAGVWTRIAHVINRLNYRDLPEFVRFARSEWSTGKVDICFAVAQEMSGQTSSWILPTFTEIKPYVMDALDFCLANDIEFSGLIGNGGYPPCMLDGELRYYEQRYDQIYTSGETGWYKADRCRTCRFDERCVGIRKAYVDTYGDDEIRPF